MRRSRQFVIDESAPPKWGCARFFTSVAGFMLAVLFLFLSFLGVLALGWVLETLFPQHKHSHQSTGNSASNSKLPQDVQAYLNGVGKQVRASGKDLQSIIQLSSDATAQPTMVRSPDWQTKVAAACAALESEGKALQNIAPVPQDCREMDKDVRRAGARYEEIGQEFAKGADIHHLDTTAILRAAAATKDVTDVDDKALVSDSDRIRAKFRN